MLFLKKIKEMPRPLADFIRACGHLADQKHVRVFLVGGFVRDPFLGVENFDVDVAVEGDAIVFAHELAKKFSCSVLTHKRFGTATLKFSERIKVDIATTRREVYQKPAALPDVYPGDIRTDLFRRDFTINAMAIGINGSDYGKVFDFYGGQDDIKKRLIRALHSVSFFDDPTRILRAVRFEQRYDFKIENETLEWIKDACARHMLGVVHKHRLRDELVLIFKEEKPLKVLKRLYDLCGFSYIAKNLHFRKGWIKDFHKTEQLVSWYNRHFMNKRHIEPYVMFLSLFFYDLPYRELKQTILDYAFHKAESSRILSFKENFSRIESELRNKNLRPSTVYKHLEPLSYEVILLIMALSKSAETIKHINDFLFIYNGQSLCLRGHDLAKMGACPGPQFKRILEELLFAKIDGKVKGKEEELREAKRLIEGK